MASFINKSRKPKFELHLKIYDLNNVPLVSGGSSIKWHLPHSLHSDHRGRTQKQPIVNHRVDYNYAKIIPVRLVVDRSNRLSDCPIEFEVTQEFDMHGTNRDEKILLGKVNLNLAEYVAESEGILRDKRPGTAGSATHGGFAADASPGGWHGRKRSSLNTKAALSNAADSLGAVSAPGSSGASTAASDAAGVEDGVTRRYLMQDSKINGTLRISILMVQVDGEHNFVAPALKSAAVFGGITGIMASGEAVGPLDDEEEALGSAGGSLLSTSIKSHDTAEVQDVYRRALAASWACQSTELPADECIEDIFGGGDGFRSSPIDAGMSGSQLSLGYRSLVPSGSAMSHALRGTWGPPSPSQSSVLESEAARDPSPSPSVASSGSRKHGGLLPRLNSIRQKVTAPTVFTGHQAVSVSGRSGRSRRSRRDADGASVHTASSDDAASSIHSLQSGPSSAGRRVLAYDDGDYDADNHATLRPRDRAKVRGPGQMALASPPASPSASTTALRLLAREDSGLSGLTDGTVQGYADVEADADAFVVPRSSAGPPSVQALQSMQSLSLGHRRDGSSESTRGAVRSGHSLAASRADSGSIKSMASVLSGSGKSTKSGSGKSTKSGKSSSTSSEDAHRRLHAVTESDLRDNFVAWQLPHGDGSVSAS